MAYVERHEVSLTTDGSGDATEYTPSVTGHVTALILDIDGLAAGADVTVTGETSGIAITTSTNSNTNATLYPRPLINEVGDASQVANTYDLSTGVPVANERVKIVIADGGASNTATVDVIIH